jgi:hypothetical protein
MPRYYFHLCNGSGFTEDHEGSEHPGPTAARTHAIRGLRDIMAGEMQAGELNLGSFIEIENDAHEWVMTVPFEEAVNVSTVKGERGKNAGKD